MGVFSVRKTKEEFVNDAIKVHGNEYDYSKVDYIRNNIKVCIICPKHGEFWQTPNAHLCGRGCPLCKCEVYKHKIYGVGINDTLKLSNTKPHKLWLGILERCYSEKTKEKRKTYIGCSVCEEWLLFSNFKKWFDENYIEGWHLDKDILVKGNRVYSPQTCCFVPQEINSLLTNRRLHRGKLPVGVKRSGKFFVSECQNGGTRIRVYGHKTVEDAFVCYKELKEERIKNMANKWKERLSENVYEALCNYKIDFND